MMVTAETILRRRRRRAVLVGCGAIGSHAAPLLARLPDLGELYLIDPDTYAETNLPGQAIVPGEVGVPKVTALARRLQRQAPELLIKTAQQPVERVPRGVFRDAVLISAVDSRGARAVINEIGWHWGVPIIDTGVDGPSWLARCNVYRPQDGHACIECGWTVVDYRAKDAVVSCQGAVDAVATNAPASLSSIAAGLLVGACQQLWAGQLDPVPGSYQVLYDCRHHRCHRTAYSPNPACRFDHQIWDVQAQAVALREITLAGFVELVAGPRAGVGTLHVPGHLFVRRLLCSACGALRDRCLVLERALTPARTRCRACGGRLVVSGFHAESHLGVPLERRHARRTMWSLGLRPGDVVALSDGATVRHIELSDPPAVAGGNAPPAAQRAGGECDA